MNAINSYENSVRMGEIPDYGLSDRENRAFPFFYNFVNAEDDRYEQEKAQGFPNYEDRLVDVGPLVNQNGGSVLHPIRMDPDYNFKLLWLRYTAYYIQREGGSNDITWYTRPPGFFLEQGDYQSAIGTPFTQFIRISVFMSGLGERYLYGGAVQNQVQTAINGLVPVEVSCIQGYEYGYAQVLHPILLPKEGTLMLRITNLYDLPLHVGGIAAGLKVRI